MLALTGMETSSLVSDTDLMDEYTSGMKRTGDQQINSTIIPALSAREKNQLKRRARTGSRLESQNSIQSNVTVRINSRLSCPSSACKSFCHGAMLNRNALKDHPLWMLAQKKCSESS